jgi:hypothetical protein
VALHWTLQVVLDRNECGVCSAAEGDEIRVESETMRAAKKRVTCGRADLASGGGCGAQHDFAIALFTSVKCIGGEKIYSAGQIIVSVYYSSP